MFFRPLVTEKGVHRATRHNQYAFEIHRDATKTDAFGAVESLFGRKGAKVRTQTRKASFDATKCGRPATSDWKRAIVQLHPDHKIELL
ncbi:UNVERIFIED_CONTAM: hypothetical protein GTU68_010616 [Idotea baltica]|nr:hypothetical protein [Idotea baltica]